MLENWAEALEISVPILLLVGALSLLQLAIQVWALVDLARRPVTAALDRWVWLVIVVVGGLIGSAVYLAVGRRYEYPLETNGESTRGREDVQRRTRSAADVLYGEDRGEDS